MYGDRDGDGFVEYERRSGPRAREPVVEGLRRLAAVPRRPARGDADRAGGGAGVRLRREAPARRGGARTPGATSGLAARLERRGGRRWPHTLRRGRTGSRTAAGTTRWRSIATSAGWTRSARTSATCSGAASSPRERVEPIVDALMRHELWSGWGFRTMSQPRTRRTARSATTTGRVWPHDTTLAAWALRGTGAGTDVRPGWRSALLEAGPPLRLVASRGLRRLRPRGDACFPIAISDCGAAAGLGRRGRRSCSCGSCSASARHGQRAAGHTAGSEAARPRAAHLAGRTRARSHVGRLVVGRRDRHRGGRVDRVAPRGRPGRRRPRRHAVRFR